MQTTYTFDTYDASGVQTLDTTSLQLAAHALYRMIHPDCGNVGSVQDAISDDRTEAEYTVWSEHGPRIHMYVSK